MFVVGCRFHVRVYCLHAKLQVSSKHRLQRNKLFPYLHIFFIPNKLLELLNLNLVKIFYFKLWIFIALPYDLKSHEAHWFLSEENWQSSVFSCVIPECEQSMANLSQLHGGPGTDLTQLDEVSQCAYPSQWDNNCFKQVSIHGLRKHTGILFFFVYLSLSRFLFHLSIDISISSISFTFMITKQDLKPFRSVVY